MYWREQARSPRSLVLSFPETSDRLPCSFLEKHCTIQGYQAGLYSKLISSNQKQFVTNHRFNVFTSCSVSCNQDLGTLMVRPIQDLSPLHVQKYPLRQAQKVNKTRHDYPAPEKHRLSPKLSRETFHPRSTNKPPRRHLRGVLLHRPVDHNRSGTPQCLLTANSEKYSDDLQENE